MWTVCEQNLYSARESSRILQQMIGNVAQLNTEVDPGYSYQDRQRKVNIQQIWVQKCVWYESVKFHCWKGFRNGSSWIFPSLRKPVGGATNGLISLEFGPLEVLSAVEFHGSNISLLTSDILCTQICWIFTLPRNWLCTISVTVVRAASLCCCATFPASTAEFARILSRYEGFVHSANIRVGYIFGETNSQKHEGFHINIGAQYIQR